MAHERVPNRVRFVCANFKGKTRREMWGDERKGVVDFLEFILFIHVLYVYVTCDYV